MRSLLRISMTLILLLVMTSCATKKIQLPEKYLLDNQLERVEKVSDVRAGRTQPAFTTFEESFEDPLTVMARRDTVTFSESKNQWIKVDLQSFILRSSPGIYYLLVLHAPAPSLMSTDTISFTLLTNTINSGNDYLNLGGAKYLVERIYKIESNEQMYAIRHQLRKSEDTEK